MKYIGAILIGVFMGELTVREFEGDILLTNNAGQSIQIDKQILFEFCKYWVEREGYDVTKQEPELLQCPFCGGKCKVFTDREDFYSGVVECERCGYRSRIMQTPEEARHLHNLIAKNALPRD